MKICFQYWFMNCFTAINILKGEKRFPDEMMGITYPLSKENVELRNQERTNLYCALLENNLMKKKHYLNAFIALREKEQPRLKST